MCEFDFDIKHNKGKQDKFVDALSRRVHVMHVSSISMYKSDLKTRILEAVIIDVHYYHIKKYNRKIYNKNMKVTGWKIMEFLHIKLECLFLIQQN